MPQTRFFDTLDSDKQNAQKAEEWLRDIEVICHKLLNEGESKGTTLPIKVAIIDTGVDAKHPELSGKIGRDKPFRDIAEFRDGKGITNHTFPRGEDEAPHGTHVAALLNRIAPLALIYIARVGFGSGELEPDYVAAAIRYATSDWKVNIISMSLGFEYDYPTIGDAIREARSSNILLFAAASNNGNMKSPRVAYPARHEQVISVSAANVYSTQLAESNPTMMPRGSLAALGIDVPSAWPGSTEPQPKSGSSMATPIVAGIAALILQFVRQLVTDPPQINDDSAYKKSVWKTIELGLRESPGLMTEVLQGLGIQGGSFCGIQPQIAFKERGRLYNLIWRCFQDILDPDAATEATLTMSQQQSKAQRDVKSALQLLKRQLPAPTTPDFASERWPSKSEGDPRISGEICFWLDNHVQTPCLWLEGRDENGMGRSLVGICQEEQGSIFLHCTCNQFDAYGEFLGPVDILRQANYSALYQALSHFDDQGLATPENFDLNPYFGLDDSPGKSLESMMRVQELIADLLSHAKCPVLWVIENYDVLEDERSECDPNFRQVLHGFLKLAGGLHVLWQGRNTYRCLFLARSRPAPSTEEVIGNHMALFNTDENSDRWM